KTGFRNTIKGGKFLLKGIQKGAVKGAKSFKQLAKKLGDKLKFDKYRFTFKNRRFKLEGHLNPWVKLAEGGEIVEVDEAEVKGISPHQNVVTTKGEGTLLSESDIQISKTKVPADQWNNFKRDFEGNNEALELLNKRPELIETWQKLDELGIDNSIKNNILSIEVANKIEKPFFDNDIIANNKKLRQVLEGLNQLDEVGDVGKYIAKQIKKGQFEDVEDFAILIGSIKKSGNPVDGVPPTIAGHPGFPVGQTLKRMEKSKVPNSRKVLEDKTAGDIDYGELATDGIYKYSKAYQFKSAADPKKVSKAINTKTIKKQLQDVDAEEKIFEVEMRSGTLDDLKAFEQSILDRVNDAKNAIPDLKINITDLEGNIIKSF
ncbi:hypothetical protein, partial [Aureibacter tunicatorum]